MRNLLRCRVRFFHRIGAILVLILISTQMALGEAIVDTARVNSPTDKQPQLTDQQWKALSDAAVAAIFRNIDEAEKSLGFAPGAIPASTGSAYDHVKGENQQYNLFTWVRDSALAAMAIVDVYRTTTNPALKIKAGDFLMKYANFNIELQSKKTTYGYGDGKYHKNGDPITEEWGGPQNDGPALRAVALSEFASALISEGLVQTARFLYRTAISRDLDYIAKNYNVKGVDWWEEHWKNKKGFHFSTLIAQQDALNLGQKLARQLDLTPPEQWNDVEQKIEEWLPKFWNPETGIFVATLDSDNLPINNGRSENDSLNYMALLGPRFGVRDSRITASNPQMMATVGQFVRQFDHFPINQKNRGHYVGRYFGDTYFGGNVWAITTMARYGFDYLVARDASDKGLLHIDNHDLTFLRPIAGNYAKFLRPGITLSRQSEGFKQIMADLIQHGDKGLIDTLTLAVGKLKFDPVTEKLLNPLYISEQYSRDHGGAEALPNLTWNYSVLYHAILARQKAVAALRSLGPQLSLMNCADVLLGVR